MGHDEEHGHGHGGGHSHAHGHGHKHGATPAHGESPAREHRSDAPTHVSCFVLTCSDSRSQAEDVSGRALREGLEAAGHAVVGQTVVRDEPEAIRPLLDREIPGFGELFRMLSFQEIGSAAWLSRALAGTVRGALVFVLPGSPNAVRLALERLILPELGHAVRELSR